MEGGEDNWGREENAIGENGLIKKILKEVHYVARMDAIQFDCSGNGLDFPFVFNLGKGKGLVMEGCADGIKTMRKGEKALFTVPQELASVTPNSIPLDSIIEVEIELVDWKTLQNRFKDGEGDKGKSKRGFHMSYEELISHFGKKQSDAAKDIGVSEKTLRRVCGEYGITSWPPFWRKEKIPSKPSRSTKGGMITVKTTFKGDMIKFELRLSLGATKIMQEVDDRFKLKRGTFKLKYVDEDGDLILLACESDLDLCAKRLRLLGKSTVHVLVELVTDMSDEEA